MRDVGLVKNHSFGTSVCVDWYIFNENFVFIIYFNVCVMGIFYHDTNFNDSCSCAHPGNSFLF
jgi:hypothetical protein